jgi:leucyl/phenylalanyl-tRNA---protein transferase
MFPDLPPAPYSFPAKRYWTKDGIVATGGDLSPALLLTAYSQGIFPWYEHPYPITWWSPDPRMVLFPTGLKISKSLRQALNRRRFEVRVDTAFADVIKNCASANGRGKDTTWLTDEMIVAYTRLHELGFAHSFEAFIDNRLAGGLYGLSLGGMFFGESMFHFERDASKVALVYLVRLLQSLSFDLIDVQQETPHMASMGAVAIKRSLFFEILSKSLQKPIIRGKWSKFGNRTELLNPILE